MTRALRCWQAVAASILAACVTVDAHTSVPPSDPSLAAPGATRIVALRRLTESQYRNTIAEIFGPGMKIIGRFAPIVRPAHALISTGAASAAISPSGFEQFDLMARSIAAQALDVTHRATYLPCAPQDFAKPDPSCAAHFLGSIGRYIFRRPLTAEELGAFTEMAALSTANGGNFYSGEELALAAMLVSPHFLYIVERARPVPGSPDQWELDAYSKASRLSYFLWNTTPDESLLSAAAHGDLDDPARLNRFVDAMTNSPRFEAGVRAFFSDMLIFEKFDAMSKDPLIYRTFNQKIAHDMPEQILRTIVAELVTRRGDYRDLFTTRRTFMTRALGPLYNVPADASGDWQPYEFATDSGRTGILSLAGFLAVNSHPGRSSPTLRGIAIREALLCQAVPQPPGNVNFTVVQDTNNPTLRTALARLTAHRTDPVCAACHQIMDPIGLPLEHFDGSGAYRETENGATLDVSGRFEKINFDGAGGLGEALAKSTSTTRCVASRAYEYAHGTPLEADSPTLQTLLTGFAAAGYRLPALFSLVARDPQSYRFDIPTDDREVNARATAANGSPVRGDLK